MSTLTLDSIREIAVIGAGQMGNGIVHVFAQSGYKVTMIDIAASALEKAVATITKNLDRQVTKGTIDEAAKQATLANISTSTDLAAAVAGADLVVEAATENIDLKLKIFKDLDSAAPQHCILATNTSSISITRIAAATTRPQQVIGMHFMNPVPVMKLVEIIRGLQTSDETYEVIADMTKKLYKTGVESKDFPGFISNRILMPMINEAIYTVYEGVASIEDVDTVMKLGMNHPMGPLTLADFIGLDTCLYIMEVLYEGFGDSKYRPCPLLRQYVQAGWYGRKSGRGFYVYE